MSHHSTRELTTSPINYRKQGTHSPLLAAALTAAAHGWHVFPLRPNDKRPTVHNWEIRATTDPDRITRCWATGTFNIGIACGPSGLVVIDLDIPKDKDNKTGVDTLISLETQAGEALPPTYRVRTGRGGQHLYFTHPAGPPELRNTAGALGPLIDTRAHGGYVVAVGSIVNGNPYTVDVDTNPLPLPAWFTKLLAPAPLPPQVPIAIDLTDRRRSGYLTAAITAETQRVTTAPKGERNRALYLAAIALGQLIAGGALTETEVRPLLEHAAAAAGLGLIEIYRTLNSGLKAGARRPRSVAA